MLCTCNSSNNHPHLQLVVADNLLALRLELRHVPRTAHIPPRQPRPALLAHPDERVRRELGRVDERGVSVLRHRERQLGGHGPGVHCDGDEPRPLRAVLDVEELREPQQRELARLGGRVQERCKRVSRDQGGGEGAHEPDSQNTRGRADARRVTTRSPRSSRRPRSPASAASTPAS